MLKISVFFFPMFFNVPLHRALDGKTVKSYITPEVEPLWTHLVFVPEKNRSQNI